MKTNMVAGSLLKVAALAGLLLAGTAQAMPTTWATLNTVAHSGDTSPSDALAMNYSAYLCTAETAEMLFGSTALAEIEEYITHHYSKTAEGTKALENPYYVDGSYTLDCYDGTVYSSADYIAVAFYGDREFRVYGNGSAQLVNGSLVFDDASAPQGTVGDWRTASDVIPEPSSGLLLMVGGVLLTLRRRRK